MMTSEATAAIQTGSFETDRLTLRYANYGGDGPPLILLHGLTGYARSWDPIATGMTGSHHVYALDQRGHGDSDHAGDYGVRKFAADALAFADHLGAATFDLCGLSLGARNAMPVGGEHPERLRHLVLVDMAPEMAQTGARNVRSNIGKQVDLSQGFADADAAFRFQIGNAPDPDDAAAQARIRAGIPHAFRTGDDGRLYFKYDQALFTITGRAAIPEQPYLWDCLRRATCPTLVVRGETSDVLSRELVERMLEHLPNGQAVEIQGAGHPVPYDQPEAFLRELQAFLAS